MKKIIIKTWRGLVSEVYTDTEEPVKVVVLDEEDNVITDEQEAEIAKMHRQYDTGL